MPRFAVLWRGLGLGLGLAAAVWGQAAAPAWTRSGPASLLGAPATPLAGGVDALAVTAQDGVFAGGAGGVFRLQGPGWQGVSDGAPVSTLAASSDGATLYAGTGDVNDQTTRAGEGLWRSLDGGETWTLVAPVLSGLAIARIAVDPADSQHLVAATQIAADSTGGATAGLYASEDGGATWTLLLPGNMWDVAWNGSGMLAVTAQAAMVSADDGTTFTAISSGLPGDWQRAAACAGTQGGYWLAALGTGATPALFQLDAAGSVMATIPLPQGMVMTAEGLALAEDSSGNVWLGGADLWELEPGAPTWTNWTAGTALHGGQHSIVFAPDGSSWAGNDNGVWQAGPGIPFSSRNGGLANTAVIAMALTGSGVVAALADGSLATGGLGAGSSWTETAALGPGGAPIVLAHDSGDPTGDTVYAASRDQIWRSGDGGASWNTVAAAPAAITAMAAGGGRLWVGTASGSLLSSSDGGNSLAAVAGPPNSGAILALAMGSAPTMVWSATPAGIFCSSDGGASWPATPMVAGAFAALAVDAARPAVIAAAGSTGVQVSFDAGKHWILVNTGLTAAPVTTLAFDAAETLWAGTFGQGMWSVSTAGAGAILTLTPQPGSAPAGSVVTLLAGVTAWGQPISGVAVNFAASGTPAWTTSAVTGNDGQVSVPFTAPNAAAPVALAATAAPGNAAVSANATLTVLPGPAAAMAVVSGAGQSATNGQTLPQPVVLAVTDAYGNPVPNVAVSLSATAGTLAAANATTDSTGRVTVSYSLPAAPGSATLTAQAGGLTQSWTETALPSPDFALELTAPSAGASPNQVATLTLQVVGMNGYNQPVALACVAPSVGCSITPATVAPGQTATVAVALSAAEANQASLPVQVAGPAGHSASATLLLQAFTLTADNNSLSVQTGASPAALQLQAVPLNGLTGAVTLTATLADGSPLPANVAALFQPAGGMFVDSGAAVAVTLSISAENLSATPWLWLVAGLGCVALGWRRRRRIGLVAAAALASLACGGGPPPPATPPAVAAPSAYSLSITAAAAGLQASVPLTLTVMP